MSDCFASRIDAFAHGEYRRPAHVQDGFSGRITANGSSGFPADVGRYHLYSARTSPAAHRLDVPRSLAGLDAAMSVSHVHGLRDGRGWAFRASTGPDPINGFTLLREAYEARAPATPTTSGCRCCGTGSPGRWSATTPPRSVST